MVAGKSVLDYLIGAIGGMGKRWKKAAGAEAVENAKGALNKVFGAIGFRRAGRQAVVDAGQAAGGGSKLFRGIFGFAGGDAGFEAKNTIAAVSQPLAEYASDVQYYRTLKGKAAGITKKLSKDTPEKVKAIAKKVENAYANGDVDAIKAANKDAFDYIKTLKNADYREQAAKQFRETGLGELLNARGMSRYNSSYDRLKGSLNQVGAEIADEKALTNWAANASASDLKALRAIKPDTGLSFWGKSAVAGITRGGLVGGVARASLPFVGIGGTIYAFKKPFEMIDVATEEIKRNGGL